MQFFFKSYLPSLNILSRPTLQIQQPGQWSLASKSDDLPPPLASVLDCKGLCSPVNNNTFNGPCSYTLKIKLADKLFLTFWTLAAWCWDDGFLRANSEVSIKIILITDDERLIVTIQIS